MKKSLSYVAIIAFAGLLSGTAAAQQTKLPQQTAPKAPVMIGKKLESDKIKDIQEPVVSAPVAAKDIPSTVKGNASSVPVVPQLIKLNEAQNLQAAPVKPVAINPATNREISAALAKKQAEQYPEIPAASPKPPVLNMTPPVAGKAPVAAAPVSQQLSAVKKN